MNQLFNKNAAGIDISSKDYYVAVPEDRAKESVRCFGAFTSDLHKIASWLKTCKITTVAMESTGVYWYQLYLILLDYGFEVYLVNAYHVKNVPGRKTDVSDAQWIQKLHSNGYLRACFQPDNITRTLRNYVRQRKNIINQMTRQTNQMIKALTLMNIKLNNVIRDIHGKTGRLIIESILKGERNPKKLSLLRDKRIKASPETLEKSLTGDWREEQLFNLRQSYDHYMFLENQLRDCDYQSERIIQEMENNSIPKKVIPIKKNKKINHTLIWSNICTMH
ncbi:MAG: IS110 family transposase [Bacteroidetes bacterium]|nr:MAG: IS110 family transposase [Bacteroidota bacterium]